MEETWVSRYFRDSRLLSIGGGADEVMLQILARLDGFSDWRAAARPRASAAAGCPARP